MKQTRRHFMAASAAVAGSVVFLPYAARAGSRSSDVFKTTAGDITVHPVDHASFVMETPLGTIYSDPVGDAASYAGFPRPDLILVTHQHGDHYNAETLAALVGENTMLITNPAVYGMLPDPLKAKATQSRKWRRNHVQGARHKCHPGLQYHRGKTEVSPQGA